VARACLSCAHGVMRRPSAKRRRITGKWREVLVYSSDEAEVPDMDAIAEGSSESGSSSEDDLLEIGSPSALAASVTPARKNKESIPRSLPTRASDLRAAKFGLQGIHFRRMLRNKIAPILFNILLWLHNCSGVSNEQDTDYIEFFAGVAAVKRHVASMGWKALAYDVDYHSKLHNILGKEGFLTAVQWLRRLRVHGGTHWATVCSTWVWICRATSGRTEDRPLGRPELCRAVDEANMMVSRCALLLLWLQSTCRTWILEQPSSSLMCLHPRMLFLRDICGQSWRHTHTWMGMFGASTPKATRLWSSSRSVYALHRRLDTSLSCQWDSSDVTSRTASGGISGGPGLKDTQSYPEGYGAAVAREFTRSQKALEEEAEEAESDTETAADPTDSWPDAGLQELAGFLGVPHDRLMA